MDKAWASVMAVFGLFVVVWAWMVVDSFTHAKVSKQARKTPPRPGGNEGTLAHWYWLIAYGSREEIDEWEAKYLPSDIRQKRTQSVPAPSNKRKH